MKIPAARVVFRDDDRAEIAAAVTDILASGCLTLGPYTERFETAFAQAHRDPDRGARYAVATSSGTAALDIILRTAGVAGRDVIVPANTFFATAAAVLQAGGRPVFADVDAATLALSAATVRAALTPKTAAVVLVHIGGLITAEVDALRRLCEEHGIVLVEDAAHAHGSSYDGRFAGSFGLAAAFSFYPTKVVTSGEGGMVVTGSAHLRDEARIYRDQGKGAFTENHHVRLGSAMRMSELHAVTGLVHLRRMDTAIERRRGVAARYSEELSQLDGLELLEEPAGGRGNFYKYIAILPRDVDRTGLKRAVFDRHGVRLPGEVYDLPLHKQPVFAEFAAQPLPVAEDLCARHVCLPVYSDMRDDEVDAVVAAVSHTYRSLAGA